MFSQRKKKKTRDQRKLCKLCGEKLSRRAIYNHAKFRTCVKSAGKRQPPTESLQQCAFGDQSDCDSIAESHFEGSAEHTFNDIVANKIAQHGANENYFPAEISSECADSEMEDSIAENTSSDDTSDEEPSEVWNDLSPQDLLEDMEAGLNCPVEPPSPAQSSRNVYKALVTWILYFLLVWQAAGCISDNGLEWLLCFLSKFFNIVGLESSYIAGIAAIFPGTLYMMRKFLGLDRDRFKRYIVCPKCMKLYHSWQCTKIVNGRQVAVRCSNMVQKRRSQVECGHQLVKEVLHSGNKKAFIPLKVYCFNSIIESLEKFVKRDGFEAKCEQWREREINADEYGDVYDGQVWQDFLNYKGQPFLSKPRNYGLMMNLDWFQPYKRRSDFSVGVIYLVLMNLPREERFKRENIFLVGIIPALSKEPASINEFLVPIVDELKALWKGLSFVTRQSPLFPLKFRAALMCASSDIPAARKLCGFLSHAGRLGCSRCFKQFPGGFNEKNDYSGFCRETWEPRTDKEQRRRAYIVKGARSKNEKKQLERKFGARYTTLLELEYYDSVRCCTIDPMHNLFLGTAKSMFKLWLESDILKKDDIKEIDLRIGNMNVMTNAGRLPSGISSNYGSFTAEEWKNWTVLFSMYCLKGLLPEDHLRCWQSFVLACRILCRPFITSADIAKGDFLLLKFCKTFENLYGTLAVKPNMHLHGHLKDCIVDFGPLYGFWCFSFERYNGLLGSYKTNHHAPEAQIMRKFIVTSFCDDLSLPWNFRQDFGPIVTGGEHENTSENAAHTRKLHLASSCCLSEFDWGDISMVTLPDRFRRSALGKDDLVTLLATYTALYPHLDWSRYCPSQMIRKYDRVELGGESFGSKLSSRSLRSARIRASWLAADGSINTSALSPRPGLVHNYFKHEMKIGDSCKTHIFAAVVWYKEHPKKDHFGNPVEVWREKEFESSGSCSFVPVQRIAGTFAAATQCISNIDSLIVCPLSPKIYI